MSDHTRLVASVGFDTSAFLWTPPRQSHSAVAIYLFHLDDVTCIRAVA